MEEGRGRKWLVERDENSLRSAPDRKGEGGGLLASYQNMPEPYSTVLRVCKPLQFNNPGGRKQI